MVNGSSLFSPESRLYACPSKRKLTVWPVVSELNNTILISGVPWTSGLAGTPITIGSMIWQIPQTAWSHMLSAPETLALGPWHHVAATYDGQLMRLFIDGEEQGTLERSGAIGPSNARFCIGSYGTGNLRNSFQGVLDEMKIYDRALSAEEVVAHSREYAK